MRSFSWSILIKSCQIIQITFHFNWLIDRIHPDKQIVQWSSSNCSKRMNDCVIEEVLSLRSLPNSLMNTFQTRILICSKCILNKIWKGTLICSILFNQEVFVQLNRSIRTIEKESVQEIYHVGSFLTFEIFNCIKSISQ